MKRSGRKSAAQTPAPQKERVYGSKKNPVGSAASQKSATKIKLSKSILNTLKEKVKEYNEKHKDKVSTATAKAVMRRGMGAYSKSHRPTITGGAPNSRQAWGFARVNKFLKKKSGEKVKKSYIQDDDLLEKGGLLASNGKKSNLTLEQYKLVRTPEFKAWFGDWENDPENASKVVDENGEPKVVSHSTRKLTDESGNYIDGNPIDVFEQSNYSFSTGKTTAKPIWFSYEGVYMDEKVYKEIINIKLFLNLKKVLKKR